MAEHVCCPSGQLGVGVVEGRAERATAAAAAKGIVGHRDLEEIREVRDGDRAVGPGTEAINVGWVSGDAMSEAAISIVGQLITVCDEVVERVSGTRGLDRSRCDEGENEKREAGLEQHFETKLKKNVVSWKQNEREVEELRRLGRGTFCPVFLAAGFDLYQPRSAHEYLLKSSIALLILRDHSIFLLISCDKELDSWRRWRAMRASHQRHGVRYPAMRTDETWTDSYAGVSELK